MTDTTVEIVPGPNLPTEFTARISQPSTPTPSPIPPVGLVEIETATALVPGPPGPTGPQGPQGPAGSPDTGAQILTKLAPVDGSGSGLDADLLDGQDGAYYLAWANFTGKPATFPPMLPIAESDVTNLVSDLAAKLNSSTAATTYAPIASPLFTGDARAVTPVSTDNDTSIATTAFVQTGLTTKIGDAPSDGTQYVRQNAAWSPVSVPPGTFIGDNPPASPAVGQLWWQSSTGALFLFYLDPSGLPAQWVQVNTTATAPVAARLQAQWVSGATVANGIVWLAYDPPRNGTVNSLTYLTGSGSFTTAIQIAGTNVTGLSAVAVSSATPATVSATAANTFNAGQIVSALISAATGSPTGAMLSLNVTWR